MNDKLEKFIYSRMGRAEGNALIAFADADDIPDDRVRSLANLSGRGYRHPASIDGWRRIYGVVRGAFDGVDRRKENGDAAG